MGRILAIDYGTKRVGLAVTDPLQIIASPLETIHSSKIIGFLKNYLLKEEVDEFVLGYPKNLKNQNTDATKPVEHFFAILKKTFPAKKVSLIDERFTSKIAMDSLIASGASRKDRRNKENIDKISAAIILKSYLDSKA